jgi:benzoyl-CoA reductase/2-hydroxyglutaryl-CoA dehydratase subunit BcrC/BadD/HgdB
MERNGDHADSQQALSYACSYVPAEIIIAAGLVPTRALPENRPSDADSHIHANTCFFVKSILACALEGKFSKNARFVFINSCDGMRKLYDIWKRYVAEARAFFIDIPKKQDPDSIEFFASELRRFINTLEEEFQDSTVTQGNLEDAIKTCNKIRRQMGQVFELERAAKPRVRGSDIFDLTLKAGHLSSAELSHELAKFLSTVEEKKPLQDGPRIVLYGNIINSPDLIKLLEHSGAQVVALDTCFGVRHYDLLVEEDSSEPIRALAKRYLLRAPCARMEGFQARFQYMRGLVDSCKADGVVYSVVKFCDSHVYDLAMLADSFKAAGIPFLFIENDYEWTGMGQIATRVEAFLEMIRRGGSGNV